MTRLFVRPVVLFTAVLLGCSPVPQSSQDHGMVGPLHPAEGVLTSSGVGPVGPPDITYSETAVWTVSNTWSDTDTAAAREAGIAWDADSGLSWDEKYSLWVDSMMAAQLHSGYGTTFDITTPTGKVLPAPNLECAEVAYFLRTIFSSWYNLPFYMEAVDGNGDRIFLGHFGFVNQDGSRYGSTPKFSNYRDDSAMTASEIAAEGWPRDDTLRSRKVYGEGDEQPFISEDAHFGAYFDELLLNKRTGYFLMMLLPSFGSIHLADDSVAWHIATDGLRPGDLLIKRWQRKGIGHVMVVKEVSWHDDTHATAEIASGSMPRRQPKWDSPTGSKMNFTSHRTGGQGDNADGDAYVDLGGGLKSFLSAMSNNGHWYNQVPTARLDDWLPTSSREERAARPDQFNDLLSEPDPADLRDALLALIEEKREHLRNHPSSCSARSARELYFDELYDLMQRQWGWNREQVDEAYRQLEDYVFAELAYSQSKTCCWNSTSNDMFEVVMDYNLERAEDQPDTCVEPLVFMARDGEYAEFAAYAEATDRGDLWVQWSADESCPQAGVSNDTQAEHEWTDYCVIEDALLDLSGEDEDTGADEDAFEPNESATDAAEISEGTYSDLEITSQDEDWFRIDAGGQEVSVTIQFSHSDGDLDLQLRTESGEVISQSAGTLDSETVQGVADIVWVRVFGYANAGGAYDMKVVVD